MSVGGAANRTVLNGLVSTLVEFLSSEDWAARKAAAETLGRLAVAERDLLAEFKPSCIASLDSRRFDKVFIYYLLTYRIPELLKILPRLGFDHSIHRT